MTRRPRDEFAACIGIDWADANHEMGLHVTAAATREGSVLEHRSDPIAAWVSTWRPRFPGPWMALGLALPQGPLVSALRQADGLGRCPSNPLRLARAREAFTPSQATDDPADAARLLARLRPHREKRKPRQPQRPTLRALAPLGAHRRRVVGDTVRLTTRLTSPLTHDFPQVLPWGHDHDTARCCDFRTPWPTLQAVPLARRATLERCFRDQHGRDAAGITHRRDALTRATPLTTDAGLITPKALVVQALVAPRRVPGPALAGFDQAMAPRAQRPPDAP